MDDNSLSARNELIAELVARGGDPVEAMINVDAMLEIEQTPLDQLYERYGTVFYEWATCMDVAESKRLQLCLIVLEAKIEKVAGSWS